MSGPTMTMPLQATLGRLDGLPATKPAEAQDFTGTRASICSPMVVGVFGGLASVAVG